MNNDYYPWGGDYTICSLHGCVAVVLLQVDYKPPHEIALYGPLKTENIGIEKIIANVISNPHIRYLIICGDDIKGHRPGESLIALHKFGIDDNHRIINAPGAIPYIENLTNEALTRFYKQITIINMIGIVDTHEIDKATKECIAHTPPSFGEPYIAIRIKPEVTLEITDKRALHSKIVIDYMGKIKKREVED